MLSGPILNQRTNGPVNAHLIYGPSISTQHTKPEKTRSRNDLDLQYSLIFTDTNFQVTGCKSF